VVEAETAGDQEKRSEYVLRQQETYLSYANMNWKEKKEK
jgi:hypothetical protein